MAKEIQSYHRPTYLFVFKNEKQEFIFTKYYDDPPTSNQLNVLRQECVYKRQLFGYWAEASLTKIEEEFHKRVCENNLPPENMTTVKKKEKQEN